MSYLPEFKLRLAKRVVDDGEGLRKVARSENVPDSTLSDWVAKLRIDPATDFGPRFKSPKIAANKTTVKVRNAILDEWDNTFPKPTFMGILRTLAAKGIHVSDKTIGKYINQQEDALKALSDSVYKK